MNIGKPNKFYNQKERFGFNRFHCSLYFCVLVRSTQVSLHVNNCNNKLVYCFCVLSTRCLFYFISNPGALTTHSHSYSQYSRRRRRRWQIKTFLYIRYRKQFENLCMFCVASFFLLKKKTNLNKWKIYHNEIRKITRNLHKN